MATRITATYAVVILGAPVLDVTVEARLESGSLESGSLESGNLELGRGGEVGRYDVSVVAATGGWLAWAAPWSARAEATGAIRAFCPRAADPAAADCFVSAFGPLKEKALRAPPLSARASRRMVSHRYVASAQWKQTRRVVEVAFSDSDADSASASRSADSAAFPDRRFFPAVSSVRFDPADSAGDHEPVPDGLMRHVLDPLTALLQLMLALEDGGGCDYTLPAFEGRRRFDLRIESASESEGVSFSLPRGFVAPAKACRMSFEMIAGRRRGGERSRFWTATSGENRPPMKLTLARPAQAATPIPIGIETDSMFGWVWVALTSFRFAPDGL